MEGTLLSYFLNMSDGMLFVNVTNSGTLNWYYGNSTVSNTTNANSTFYGWFYDFEGTTHGFSAGASSALQHKFNANSLSTAAGGNSKVLTTPTDPYSVTLWTYLSLANQQDNIAYWRNATNVLQIGTAYCGVGHWCYYTGGAWSIFSTDTLTTSGLNVNDTPLKPIKT